VKLTVLNVAYPLAAVGSDAVGGAEQIVATLDAALVAAGHRSLVIACEGSQVAGELVAVPGERGELDDAARARAWIRHRRAIASALARTPVDVVHLHGVDFFEYLESRAPTLVTLHLPLSHYPAQAWSRIPRQVWFNCVSSAQHRDFNACVDLLPPVTNGVAVEAFQARHARRGFALILGRICPEKGIHLALEAARLAGAPAVLAGRTYAYEAHDRYFRDEVRPRLGKTARFVGAVDFRRKRRVLAAARCVLIPSLAAETASLVAMEAAASGTPVIAFAGGALPDTVEHGRTGFIVRTVEEMAHAIGQTHRIDPEVCRAVARERFSAQTMVERYLSIYRRLAVDVQGMRLAAG
jgi:glycosyltransferase involved in cell wall biosynthesis